MLNRLLQILTILTLLPLSLVLGASPPAHAQSIIATIGVGTSPQGVAANATSNRIYVANSGSNTVSVIRGGSNTIAATIPVGSMPQGVAVNPSTNRIYVANLGSDNVSVIDGGSNTIAATIPVGSRPLGVAVNPATNRIYVGNADANSVSVIDGGSNTVVATISFASGPAGIAVNPVTNRIYVITTGASGVLSVIDGGSNAVITTLPSGSNSARVAVNPTTNRFYVTNTMIGNVSVFDGATNTFLVAVQVGSPPTGTSGIAVNPTTNHIYVTSFSPGTNSVAVIDGDNNDIVATIPNIGGGTGEVSANPATNRIYVTNPNTNDVSVIDDTITPAPPPSGIDARIEVVFPHDQQGNVRDVSRSSLVNVLVFLFDTGTLNPVPCNFQNTVRLRWALNLVDINGVASQLPTNHEVPGIPVTQAVGEQLTVTVDGRTFPAWIFNDVPVPFVQRSDLYDPSDSKQFFVVSVDDASFRTNVWSHGRDPRTFFPVQLQPASAGVTPGSPLDTVIQVVFPHDLLGNPGSVTGSPLANVAVDVFQHPLDGAVDVNALQAQNRSLTLLRALNSGMADSVGIPPVVINTGPGPGGVIWPRFIFNNVDVSAAQDPNNKYFFGATVSGGATDFTIWSHGAEARTIFPIQDVPARSGQACGS